MFLILSLVVLSACSGNEVTLSPDDLAVVEFNARYGLNVERVPVIYNEFEDRYTSVVYTKESLYRLYLNDAGVISSRKIAPLFPKGEQRVLCIVRLSEALMEELEYVKTQWENEQGRINLQHIKLADSLGFEGPIVQFINENHYVSQSEFPAWSLSNNSVQDFRNFAFQNSLDFNSYDISLFMDLDENNPSGGSGGWESSFAKVGWFYDDAVLESEKFEGLAFAAYHHEIGHVWGWEHEWSDPFLQNGFITDLSLFGWTDLDSDGVPEILEGEPYIN